MKKIIIIAILLIVSLASHAQTWLNVGNTLQRQSNGTYSNYRFNMGSPGFSYFYSKPQVDSVIAHGATYTAGYGLGLIAFQFRLDSTIAVNKNYFNTVIGTTTLNRINNRVPYSGATSDLDLVSTNKGIYAEFGEIGHGASTGAGLSGLYVYNNSASGVGLEIQAGNSTQEALYIQPYNLGPKTVQLFGDGHAIFNSSLTSSAFIKTGGTSSQFLKADGSVDGTSYAPSGGGALTYTHIMGYGFLGGNFNNTANITSTLDTSIVVTKTFANRYPLKSTTIAGFDLRNNITLASLTPNYGLVGSAYNASSTQGWRVDTASLQTINNFFPKGDTRYQKIISGTGYSKYSGATLNFITAIPNSDLSNSSVTYNGVNVALGASGTITANTTNSLTFNNSGTGDVSGSVFNGSSTKTISYNSIGAQAAGNYITGLSGDGTATGPGSATLTLATVNSNVGSFGSASSAPTFTVNGKGLITAASGTSIQIAESQVTNLTTDLASKINTSLIGANNGVAPLDAGGKVPFANLPASLMIYKGMWNPSTNTPTLSDATGTAGWVYKASVNGTANLGSGPISFLAGDFVIHNGTVWEKSVGTDNVVSVNGQQGVVVLNTDNISEGSTNKYYTNARAIGSVLTGYTSGAGTISASDNILQAIQKLNGNIASLVTGVSSVTGSGNIASSGGANPNITFTGILPSANGGSGVNNVGALTWGAGGTLGSAAYTSSSAYEVPLTFGTGLTRSANTITVNASQNITTLSNLTTAGFVKTSAAGVLSVDASTYLTANQSISFAPTGDVTGSTSGTTSLAPVLSIGTGKVTNTMLAGSIAASKLVGTDIATVGTITAGIWHGTAIADTYISSAATWNAKQAAGNYITALTGDGTATGPGSAAFTLATVNSNVGSFGSASSVSTFTVNGKGLITAASNTPIQIAESQVTNLTTDLAAKQAQLSGAGFVKISGTTISYDNSTYLTTTAAAVTYLPFAAGSGNKLTNDLYINNNGSTGVGLTLDGTAYSGHKWQMGDGFTTNGTFSIKDATAGVEYFKLNSTGISVIGGGAFSDALTIDKSAANGNTALTVKSQQTTGLLQEWISVATSVATMDRGGTLGLGGGLNVGLDATISGNAYATEFILHSGLNTAPSTSSSAGTQGEIRFTSSGVYLCTATNTWVKAAFTSF